MFRIFVIGLVISQAAAVVNSKAEVQRREAPADTYGPPQLPQVYGAPAPVYGIPASAQYPPPPPDVPPPPPSTQYGVPAQSYGPPKVHLEYGPPKVHHVPKPVYGPPQTQHHHHVHHHQAQHEVSFLDQLKATFGFGTSSNNNHRSPPPHHIQRKPVFPKSNYGPPQFPIPAGPLLPPTKNFGSFGASSSSSYSSSSSFNHGTSGQAQVSGPIPTYGPPPHLGPHFNPDIRCDGWKPIPGPAIQPDTAYGVPETGSASLVTGSGYNGNVEIGQQVIQTASHGAGSSSHGIIFDLPKAEIPRPFHVDSGSFIHGGLSAGKSSSFEISTNGIAETYGPPAPVPTYGPPPKSSNTYLPPPLPSPPKQFFAQPNQGLLPPSGVYGVPPGASYNTLAISHGSVSGNLKPWPVSGTAPIRPVLHRQPIPAGLIESIGHQVRHQEGGFSGNFRQQQQHINSYVQAPIIDIQVPHGLNSLPLDNAARPFLTQHNTQINALPLIQEPRGIIGLGGSDCGHGPSNLHLQQPLQYQQTRQQHQLQIQDSYGPPPSGNVFTSQAATFGSVEGYSNFVNPAISTQYVELPAGNVPHVEYGVPNFNQFESDNHAFGSSLKSETVKLTGEKVNVQAKENSIVVEDKPSKTLEPPTVQVVLPEPQQTQQQQQQQPQQAASDAQQAPTEYEDEATRLDVAGLTGLNVVSAQKSQSVTIPVEGARGKYELQFQATDQTGAGSAPHEQLLSEGLLQQILSAIEQPGQGKQGLQVVETKNSPQVTKDAHTDHDDVKIFLESSEAEPIISEPPAV